MKQHRYRIRVEHLADAEGQPTETAPLAFEVGNHDDILQIVAKIRERGDFGADQSAALAIGIKLFGEVMLENRDHPLFTEFKPHFLQFIKTLKKGPAAG